MDSKLNRAVITSIPSYLSESPVEETVLECRAILQKGLYVSEMHLQPDTLSLGETDIFGSLQGESSIIDTSSLHVLAVLRTVQEPIMAELLLVTLQTTRCR